ncbi:MAG: glycine oxidase ThiO [Acidobacteriota bacterium]
MPPPSDIIVVGAGIVGCAVAYELARRGAAVQIVDERAVGMGATQASAGMLAPYIETRDDSPLFDLTVRSLGLYDDFVARVVSDSAMMVAYRRTGTLEVATDESIMHELTATAEVLGRHQVDAEILDAAAVQLEEPCLTAGVVGGLLIGTHGYVSASELTRAASAAARRNGAQFVEHSRVTRIGQVDGHVEVETDRGSLAADAVVLAAGSWSGSIDVDTIVRRVPVNPVRGQLLYLAWSGPRLRRVVWSPRCYLVPWDDGTVLVGATEEHAGFEERTTVAGVRALIDGACAIAPHALDAGFLGARVGLRPGTADDLPILGPSSIVPNLIYATGHYRSGVLLAPLTAQLIADALLDQRIDPDLAAFSPARFGDL